MTFLWTYFLTLLIAPIFFWFYSLLTLFFFFIALPMWLYIAWGMLLVSLILGPLLHFAALRVLATQMHHVLSWGLAVAVSTFLTVWIAAQIRIGFAPLRLERDPYFFESADHVLLASIATFFALCISLPAIANQRPEDVRL